MTHIGYITKSFNHDIINWDFSNVTDMRKMFFHAKSFNHDIEDWNVINLEHNIGYITNIPVANVLVECIKAIVKK
jgi:hypothetical protein